LLRTNITAPRRKGDDYQDLWVLRLAAEWLSRPDNYSSLVVENVPHDEIEGEFSLDDLSLVNSSQGTRCYQVKHKEHPEADRWTLVEFLEQKVDKRSKTGKTRPSLFQKWFQSFEKVKGKSAECAFLTNGKPDSILEGALCENKIDFDKLKSIDPTSADLIKAQLGNEQAVRDFLGTFLFKFSCPSRENLQKEARDILTGDLKATSSGVDKLFLRLKEVSYQSPTPPITIQDLRSWCDFDVPKHLNQDFPLPEDFQYFDSSQHENVLKALNDPSGGALLVTGPPGAGKSTYLSRLARELTEKGRVVVRHHFHLSTTDDLRRERTNLDRVEEGLKAQFKDLGKRIGKLANADSRAISVRQFAEALAQHQNESGEAFVFIVDGLDHVTRREGEQELREFIRKSCFLFKGLWLVLGTQEQVITLLPTEIQRTAKSPIKITGLPYDEVAQIINLNECGLRLPEQPDTIKELNQKLFIKCEGNPLHLRYTLGALKAKSGGGISQPHLVDDLKEYGGSIENYYGDIWASLAAEQRNILLTIALIDFALETDQITDFLSSHKSSQRLPSDLLTDISHLLGGRHGYRSIYHDSFAVFLKSKVLNQGDRQTLAKLFLAWLNNSRWNDLKWAVANIFEYYAGNPNPLSQLDRTWLIEAITSGRPRHQILSNLELAVRSAIDLDKFGSAQKLNHLYYYFREASGALDDCFDKIWKVLGRTSAENIQVTDLHTLTIHQLRIFADSLAKSGQFALIDDVVSELNSRHRSFDFRKKGEIGGVLPKLPVAIIESICLTPDPNLNLLGKYIRQFRGSGWCQDLFIVLVTNLLSEGHHNLVAELITRLPTEHLPFVTDEITRYSIRNSDSRHLALLRTLEKKSIGDLTAVFLTLKGDSLEFDLVPPRSRLQPNKMEEHDTGNRDKRAFHLFVRSFVVGLFHGIKHPEAEQILSRFRSDERWIDSSISVLLDFGRTFGEKLLQGKVIGLPELVTHLKSVPDLHWPEDRDRLEYKFSLRVGLMEIAKLMTDFAVSYRTPYSLNQKELDFVTSGPFIKIDDLIELMCSLKSSFLETSVLVDLINRRSAKLISEQTHFSNRSEKYSSLAQLADFCGRTDLRDDLLSRAASNLLGYGYHKDPYYIEVINAVRPLDIRSFDSPESWLARLGAIADNISDLTDGDDVGYFKDLYADFLGESDVQLLLKLYADACARERLYYAETLFPVVLQFLDKTTMEYSALCRTCTDHKSYRYLLGNAGVDAHEKALVEINDLFGSFLSDERDYRSSGHSKFDKESYGVAALSFKDLADRVATAEYPAQRDEIILEWLNAQTADPDTDHRTITNDLVNLLEKHEFDCNRDLLLKSIPLAAEYRRDKLFDLICAAHRNTYGWSTTYRDKDIEEIWTLLKKHFPERYIEFFKKTLDLPGSEVRWTPRFPMSRASAFFIYFNRKDLAKEIAESGLNSLFESMADFPLETPKFLSLPTQSLFDILFLRLTWPEPLVRERAIQVLKSLLLEPSFSQATLLQIGVWLKRQHLESLIQLPLIAINAAVEENNKILSTADLTQVLQAIPISSIPIEQSIQEICDQTGLHGKVSATPKGLTKAPLEDSIFSFLSKNINYLASPYFADTIEDLNQSTSEDYLLAWYSNISQICNELGIPLNRGRLLDFSGSANRPTLPCASYQITEAIKSAFLRTVHQMQLDGEIPSNVSRFLSLKSTPADTSLLRVTTTRRPTWWPTGGLKEMEATKTVAAEVTPEISSLTDVQEGNYRLIQTTGTVIPGDGNLPSIELEIKAFGYKIHGPNLPEDAEIAKRVLRICHSIVDESRSPRPLAAFKLFNSFNHYKQEEFELGDLSIKPFVSFINPLCMNALRWWQMTVGRIYGPLLDQPLTADLQEGSLCFFRGKEQIGVMRFWLDGMKTRHYTNEALPGGSYLLANRDALEKFLGKRGLRLAFAIKTTFLNRKYDFDNPEPVDQYSTKGICKLII